MRARLIAKVCEINAIANTVGKGRDDFRVDVLVKAEEVAVMRGVTANAVRILADNIKLSFHTVRILVRKYQENIEVVDPQLKNN